jgi:AraC-like DNA-binding protein
MAKPTIAAGFPKAFLDFAVSSGADRQTLIERSNIRPADLNEPDNRVPIVNYISLLKAGIELCDEPALALLFGEAVSMSDISIVGLLGTGGGNAETVRQQINRFGRLMLDDGDDQISDRIKFVPEGDNVWLKFTSPIYVDNPLITESGFVRCVCGARAVFKAKGISIKQPFPKAIHFTHLAPSYRSEYDRVFGVPVVFGSHSNALLMDKDFLSFALPPTNSYLSGVLTAHAENLLEKLGNSKSIRRRVESLLLPLLPKGEASMNVIAGELGVSRQTLFRKLKAEGITFEKVLDELRYNLALHYLKEKRMSVNETAYLVGFSEPPAFSRAFKRWTGSSPRELRSSKSNIT